MDEAQIIPIGRGARRAVDPADPEVRAARSAAAPALRRAPRTTRRPAADAAPAGSSAESTAAPAATKPVRPGAKRAVKSAPTAAVTSVPSPAGATVPKPAVKAARRPAAKSTPTAAVTSVPSPAGATVPKPAVKAARRPTAKTPALPTRQPPAPEQPVLEHPVAEQPAPDVPRPPLPGVEPIDATARPAWERSAAAGLAFLRRRVAGEYEVDEFGFDAELTENVVVPALLPLYRRWFRTEVIGIDNIPDTGGALLVANHAGGLWALDAAMTAVAVHEEHPAHRFVRLLGADLVFRTPVLGPLARKSGSTLACNADAERLLHGGEVVGVFPEGFKGIGKPFRERYRLQRFGRGGFVAAALKTGVPIIPVSIVGSEEIHPVLGNAKTVARVLNLPYFPLTPTFPWLGPLGLVPLPSKWYIEFGEPLSTDSYGPDSAEDPMLIFELTDRVRETIQGTLYRLLSERHSVWR